VEILVGPEGGFEREEEALAVESGFFPASIGRGILRTETAAVAATAIVVAWHQQNKRQ
jgi:16S rRNA (uracil1498-N3)-methyltransferase